MRNRILAAICASAIGVAPLAAFAQATAPSGQDSTKMGTMPQTTTKATGTQGMSQKHMKHDSTHMKKNQMMKNEMPKNEMPK